MAIRNTNLGGASNWGSERILAEDLNDTFDAAANKINSLSAFWLNTDLYDVYDDFESYSTGTFTSATSSKWTIGGDGVGSIGTGLLSGGTGKELVMYAQVSGTSYSDEDQGELIADELEENRHVYAKLYLRLDVASSGTAGAYIQSKLEGGTYVTIMNTDKVNDIEANTYCSTDLLVIAKGSNTYDLYIGGKKIASDHVTATLKFYLKAVADNDNGSGTTTAYVYIDDVRQSKSVIS